MRRFMLFALAFLPLLSFGCINTPNYSVKIYPSIENPGHADVPQVKDYYLFINVSVKY